MENENLKPVEKLTPFTKMIMTIGTLPSSFYSSMTYYESMVWLYEYLKNQVIPTVNNNGEAVEELQSAFLELKEWTETYTEETIPEEINNKLDEMATDGTLQALLNEIMKYKGLLTFNTVNDLKASTNLINGSFAETYGFHTLNDKGGSKYKIRTKLLDETVDEMTIISLQDENLVAELINEENINIKQLGAYGDETHDDTNAFNKGLTFDNIFIPEGTYLINFSAPLIEEKIIRGEGSKTIIKQNNSNVPFIKIGQKSIVENLTITTNNTSETAVIILGNYNDEFSRLTDHYINNIIINGDEYSIGIDFNILTNGSVGGLIENCNILDCKGGILFKLTTSSAPSRGWLTSQSINNVKIRGPYNYGLKMDIERNNANPQLTNCKFSQIMVDVENNGNNGCVGFILSDSEVIIDNCYVFNDNSTGTSYSVDYGTIPTSKTWSFTSSIINCIFEGLTLNDDYKYLYHIKNTKYYKRANSSSDAIITVENSDAKPIFTKSLKEINDDSGIETGNCTVSFGNDNIGEYMKVILTNTSGSGYVRLKVPTTYFTSRGYYPKITAVINYKAVGNTLSHTNMTFYTGIAAIDNTPLFSRKTGYGEINNKNFDYIAYYGDLAPEAQTTPSNQFIQILLPAGWSDDGTSKYLKVYSMNLFDVVTSFDSGEQLRKLITI